VHIYKWHSKKKIVMKKMILYKSCVEVTVVQLYPIHEVVEMSMATGQGKKRRRLDKCSDTKQNDKGDPVTEASTSIAPLVGLGIIPAHSLVEARLSSSRAAREVSGGRGDRRIGGMGTGGVVGAGRGRGDANRGRHLHVDPGIVRSGGNAVVGVAEEVWVQNIRLRMQTNEVRD
jgi:hypothetical protein